MNKEPRYHVFGEHALDLWENKNIHVKDIIPGHIWKYVSYEIPEHYQSNIQMVLNEDEIHEINCIMGVYLSVMHEIDGNAWEINVTPLMLKFIDIVKMRKLYG